MEDCKIFRKYIGEMNRINWRWAVLWCGTMVLAVLYITEKNVDVFSILYSKSDIFFLGFFLFCTAWEYYQKYLRITLGSRTDVIWADELFAVHAFPVKAYFRELGRHFLIFGAVMELMLLAGIFYGNPARAVGLAFIWIFAVVFNHFAHEKRMIWKLMHMRNRKWKHIEAICSAILFLLECSLFIFALLLHVLLGGLLTMTERIALGEQWKGMPAGVNYDISLFFVIVVVAGIWSNVVLSIDSKVQEGVVRVSGKIKFRICLGFMLLLAIWGFFLYVYQNHTVSGEQRFEITKSGHTHLYTIEDVKSSRFYAEDEEFRMTLTFQDGETMQVLGENVAVNDKWEETYEGEPEYAYILAKALKQQGKPVYVQDEKELKQACEGLSAKLQKDVEEIVKMGLSLREERE